MKTTLKITGISGLITLILASTFKIMHWPGAGIIIFLAFIIFSFGYIPFLIITVRRENILKNRQGLAYIGIVAAFTVLATILFTIMHWPLQQYIVYISWIAIFWFLILLFNHALKSEENRVLNLSVILFFAILFISNIALYWVNLKNPKMTHYTLERNFSECTAIFEQQSKLYYLQKDSIKSQYLKSMVTSLQGKTDSIVTLIDNIKDQMFMSELDKDSYLRHIINKDVKTNVEGEAENLTYELANYKWFVLNKFPHVSKIEPFIETSLQFDYIDFGNPPPVVYNNLDRLLRDIRIIEYELLALKIKE